MDRELFIKLLDNQKDELKEFITASNSVLHAKTINDIELLNKKISLIDLKVDGITAHNKRQNGKLIEHEDDIALLQKADWDFESYQKNCPANLLAIKMTKPRFWVFTSLIVIGVYLTLATLYHTVGFGDLIRGILKLA